MKKDQARLKLQEPVAVLGYGISGKAAARLLKAVGIACIVFDERIEKDFLGRLDEVGTVVRSPGFNDEHVWVKSAVEGGKAVIAEMDLGYLFWEGKLIGVTGTNGKSTSTMLLSEAYQARGFAAVGCGNNEVPFCDEVVASLGEVRLAVLEVSSFQAEQLRWLRLDGVLWSNLDEDHLDWHGTMENYFKAKWKLVERCEGKVVLGEGVEQRRQDLGMVHEVSRVVGFSDLEDAELGMFSGGIWRQSYELVKAWWVLEGQELGVLEAVAGRLRPIKHRMQWVDQINGVRFWNDSKGTNFSGALGSVRHVVKEGRGVVWIGGGKHKGGDVEGFGETVAQEVAYGVLMGETAGEVARGFDLYGREYLVVDSMAEAVERAYEVAVKLGGDVVLSPGFSSFDQYRSYAERGEIYESEVLQLKRRTKSLITHTIK